MYLKLNNYRNIIMPIFSRIKEFCFGSRFPPFIVSLLIVFVICYESGIGVISVVLASLCIISFYSLMDEADDSTFYNEKLPKIFKWKFFVFLILLVITVLTWK